MIKITLTIQEKKNNKDYSYCDVDIQEKAILATKDEIKISKILLNRVRINDKVQVINENDDDLIDKILSQLLTKKD